MSHARVTQLDLKFSAWRESSALQGLVNGISEVNMDHSSTNVVVRLLLLARLSEDQTLQDKEAFCCEHNHNLMEVRTGKAPNSPCHAFFPYRLLSPEQYNSMWRLIGSHFRVLFSFSFGEKKR